MSMKTILDFGAKADGTADDHGALQKMADEVAARYGCVTVPDGDYGMGKTLVLPQGVSLSLSPGATIRALPNFEGEAMVETAPFAATGERIWHPAAIEGGVLDGASQPLVGIRTTLDRETDIRNITVRNCLRKGLHIGTEGCCETNLLNVRVQCERGVIAEDDSIGIHIDKTTDNLINGAIVIGYATGFRSDSSSNDVHQAHVWNYDLNCKLKVCFACNGWNDSYNQCYADSPMNGDNIGIGFHMTRPYQRVTASRVYGNKWVTPDRVIGIRIEDGGTHGTYVGNHFTAQKEHALKAGIDGNLEGITAIGNTYAGASVLTGKVNLIPANI